MKLFSKGFLFLVLMLVSTALLFLAYAEDNPQNPPADDFLGSVKNILWVDKIIKSDNVNCFKTQGIDGGILQLYVFDPVSLENVCVWPASPATVQEIQAECIKLPDHSLEVGTRIAPNGCEAIEWKCCAKDPQPAPTSEPTPEASPTPETSPSPTPTPTPTPKPTPKKCVISKKYKDDPTATYDPVAAEENKKRLEAIIWSIKLSKVDRNSYAYLKEIEKIGIKLRDTVESDPVNDGKYTVSIFLGGVLYKMDVAELERFFDGIALGLDIVNGTLLLLPSQCYNVTWKVYNYGMAGYWNSTIQPFTAGKAVGELMSRGMSLDDAVTKTCNNDDFREIAKECPRNFEYEKQCNQYNLQDQMKRVEIEIAHLSGSDNPNDIEKLKELKESLIDLQIKAFELEHKNEMDEMDKMDQNPTCEEPPWLE